MIYREPALMPGDREVLSIIGRQHERLRLLTQSTPARWFGTLRRRTLAHAIRGSTGIEGYDATLDEAIAAVDGEAPPDERTATWDALKGVRDALAYIAQASQDPSFELGNQFLKSLHFMMLGFDGAAYPGQWRPGAAIVLAERGGGVAYEGPGAGDVDDLVRELVAYLKAEPQSSAIIRAAMAHLNLAMIHPFKDGSGRMARALQTLVLGRDGILPPVFAGIDEWLGRNAEDYRRVLAEVGGGAWRPERDAAPWVRFCLKAHHQQAETLIRRHEEYETLFDRIVSIAERETLFERMAVPLLDAALGWELTTARYQMAADATPHMASRDLKTLTDLGLLAPHGEKRGRVYHAGQELREIRDATRINRPLADPYALIRSRDAGPGDLAPRWL